MNLPRFQDMCRHLVVGLLLCLMTSSTALCADDDAAPASQSAGLVLTLTSSAQAHDERAARMVALHVPKGEHASPLLSAPANRARWEGFINVGLRGRYTFSLEGNGKAKVTINDTVILESTEMDLGKTEPADRVRLNKGPNPILVEYELPEGSDATIRLYWQSDEFPREPVPPMVFTHDPSRLRLSAAIRDGRELFATMRCTKCHDAGDLLKDKKATALMPELNIDAPSLADAGVRLGVPWMAHWIANPKHFRADASMPSLLPSVEGKVPQEAWDIAAYLDTLGQKPPVQKRVPDSKELIAAGGDLFASLGCIGCHTLPDHVDAKTIDGRVPLKFVRSKWSRDAFTAFLLNPQKHYEWIRMPNFNVSPVEANQITAFLWSLKGETIEGPVGKGDATRGKQLVQSLGCVNCHTVTEKNEKLVSTLAASPLASLAKSEWKRGCVTAAQESNERGKAPNFQLDEGDVTALRAFAEVGFDSLKRDTADEFASRQVSALRCAACHKLDGQNDFWSNHESEVASLLIKKEPHGGKPKPDDDDPFGVGDKGEPKQEVQIDQSRPDLTWVGDKLRPQWIETFLSGKLDHKLRPWITARMPAFPIRASGLAKGLAMQHGREPVAPPFEKPDAQLAAIGKRLIAGEGKGFGCTQCHGIGKSPATNVFEAQGINFAYLQERLRKEYYMRWMLNPGRVSPGTRMPKFASDDGTTPFFDVLEGDATKQFDAMWQYFMSGREIAPP
ncbi:MAG: c-type cytochrome [Phycisphaeraceae bacterium]